jgi:hypothetical protein
MFLLQTCRCTLRLISPVSAKLPISSIIPPRLSISMPSTNDFGVFAMCSTTSAPRPPVSSRTRATRSSAVVVDALSTCSAPHRRAQASRCSDRSVAMICPAPIMSAFATCSRPSGPVPITTTVSPELKPSSAYSEFSHHT